MNERYIERRESEKERSENGVWYPIAVGTSAKEEGELLWRPNRPKMGFFQNKAKPLESRIREHSGLEEDNQETYPASETSSIRTSIGINPISVFAHLSLVLTAPRKNPGKPTPKQWLPDRLGRLGLKPFLLFAVLKTLAPVFLTHSRATATLEFYSCVAIRIRQL